MEDIDTRLCSDPRGRVFFDFLRWRRKISHLNIPAILLCGLLGWQTRRRCRIQSGCWERRPSGHLVAVLQWWRDRSPRPVCEVLVPLPMLVFAAVNGVGDVCFSLCPIVVKLHQVILWRRPLASRTHTRYRCALLAVLGAHLELDGGLHLSQYEHDGFRDEVSLLFGSREGPHRLLSRQ